MFCRCGESVEKSSAAAECAVAKLSTAAQTDEK
jgi:hypothetical protein